MPKVEAMLSKYKEIELLHIDSEKNHSISAAYSIFTIPALLLYVDGKEFIREARHISVDDLESKISRYYHMLYE